MGVPNKVADECMYVYIYHQGRIYFFKNRVKPVVRELLRTFFLIAYNLKYILFL